jgi:putative ABC transport system permease protein
MWQDIRYAWRSLRRQPGFATVALLILGLGIGANTAVFSVVNPLVLRPLPFPDGDRLVWITKAAESEGLSLQTYPVAVYEEFRRQSRSLDHLTAYFAFFGLGDAKLTGGGEAERLVSVPVAPHFFEVLGVQPALGRLFVPEEERPHARRAVLLSDGLWRRRFAGDRTIVGRTISVNDAPVTVVGVLPERFDFGSVFSPGTRVDLFEPAALEDLRNWGNTLAIIGRLKPGVTVASANAEFAAIAGRIKQLRPDLAGRTDVTVSSLKEHVSGRMRRPLGVLWSAVALVLVIVCANLTGLLLARATGRAQDLAIRSALGAGRARLLRQLMVEGVVLSIGGAGLGVALAYWLTDYVRGAAITSIPLLTEIHVDTTALVVTGATAVITGLIVGAAPGLQVTSVSLLTALKAQPRGFTAGGWQSRLRSGLVVAELALACILLVGSGLLLRSFFQLLSHDLGFQATRAVAVRVDPNSALSPAERGAFAADVQRRVTAIAGIEAVGITDMLPLDRNRQWDLGRTGDDRRYWPSAFVYMTSPGYLDAMRIPLRAGRDFSAHDMADSRSVIILNETIARQLWPDRDPIGQSVVSDVERRVVGVVADVRQTSLEESAVAQMYLPITQADPVSWHLVIRSMLPINTLATQVRAALRERDPNLVTTEFRPLESLVERATSPRRFLLSLLSGFSSIALLLACLGIYGIVSYGVAQRSREIGVRMALGATAGDIRRDVLGGTLRLTLTGLLIGVAGALAGARLVSSLLFETASTDPITFTATTLLLVTVSLVAGFVPAQRAARIDPMQALRAE